MSIDPNLDPIDSEDDLFEHFNFVVDKGQQLLRIDKYLLLKISNASRSKIQVGIEAGSVKVNNLSIKSNYRVKPYDQISVSFSHPPRDTEVYPENIPIDIIYEDDDLILVNKEAGMVVHPAHGLENEIHGFRRRPPGGTRPGDGHRCTRGTLGGAHRSATHVR